MSRQISSRGDLVRLALTTVSIQLGMMMFEVVDAVLLGEASDAAIAAGSTGGRILWIAQLIPVGILLALDPIISQAFGAGDEDSIRLGLQRGLLLCLVILPFSVVPLVAAEPILRFLDQPPEIIPEAVGYARVCGFGVPAFLVFSTLRVVLQAQGATRSLLVAILFANLLNVFLDRGLILGRYGLPALGVEGAAWASVTSRWVLVLGLVGVAWRSLRGHLFPWQAAAASPRALLRLIRLGLPLAAQIAVELGTFALTAFMVGWFGTVAVTGHQIVLQLSSVTFMVPLGVSVATGVAVGQAVGRNDPVSVRHNARLALLLGTAFMALCAFVFFFGRNALPRIWTSDSAALAMAASLLPYAALFQVFDGIQVVAIGVLRGLGDLRSPFLAHFTAFWIIGVPLGYLLAVPGGLGPRGLWWGLVAGLFSGALGLLWMVRRRLRGDLVRIDV